MTRRSRISSRAWSQVAAVCLTVTVIGIVLGHLHATAPTRTPDPILEPAEDPRGEGAEVLTCQRTLPNEPVTTGDAPSPVGRIHSAAVVSCPGIFDPEGDGGPIVTYTGEVVGDVLERRDGVWVLINDDAYALESGPLPQNREYAGTNTGLTVWIPEEDVPSDLEPGRSGRRGDVVAVRGRIHRTDPRDGGGLTLRATAVREVAEAEPAEAPFHTRQAGAALVAAVVALVVSVYYRFARRT